MGKVPDTKENTNKCLCRNCPTYSSSDCAKEKQEILFCAKGKSLCSLKEKGCLCGACLVWSKFALTDHYFCLKGEAK